ncbi:sporulation protein [Ophiostoma piceae UAMH 11346]|uniref:Sporulation protein n=1 Tax=Ophiostoma piceae (strain UAMH 11346) TaxID=1262450 RepID=S3D9B3_OPHP1|nr:sporulation protein [Ophiostoma piceae UAMH 11346]
MPSRKAASAAADSLKKRKREKVEDAGRSRKRKPQEGEEAQDASPAKTEGAAKKGANGANGAVVKAAPRAKADRSTTWKVSEPMGGAMTDIDPIFSADEEHIVIIYHNSIQIYTTADSLLERRIKLPEDERPKQIVTAVLSAKSPELLWIGCSDGALYRADWTTGAIERVQRKLLSQIEDDSAANTPLLIGMTSEAVRIGSDSKEILYLSEGSASSTWRVTAYDAAQLETEAGHVLFTAPPSAASTTTAPIQILQTEDKGRFVVGISGRMVFVGGLKATSTLSSVADLASAYQFYSLDAADEVSCVDLRSTRRKKGPALDLVVGCTRGTIYAYEDVFTRLHDATSTTTEPSTKSAPKKKTNINPRKYHWHPMSVNAVKWSKDGNYLISGGPEEVLVLWQIETSKLSFLPRLTACIENVVVSPRGSSYAVHLDDNSTMILSTAEMVPTFYASGLQSVTLAPSSAAGAISAGKEANSTSTTRVWQPVEAITKPVPAVVNPADASRILVRVGNGQRSTKTNSESPSASMVQAFDVTDFRSINKQPLARSNATDVNTTRQGHHVTEPTITQLCASRDGKWLASVDEWQPPERDVGGIPGEPSLKKVWARDRREVHLKFWAMDRNYELEEDDEEESGEAKAKKVVKRDASGKKTAGYQRPFELISRIDEAHFTTKTESIFGVAADTNHGSRFATLGDDAVVRFWSTKTRVRDGLVLKDHTGAPLVSWHCTQSVSLPLGESDKNIGGGSNSSKSVSVARSSPSGKTTARRSGALAYSEDGSTVFAAFGDADEAVLYTIDTESGVVRNSLQGMFRGEVRGVEVLGSSLVLLSADLRVYDIVADELRYGVNLMHSIPASDVEAATALTQLAVGRDADKFVVAVPYKLASAAPALATGASLTATTSTASSSAAASAASRTRFASRLVVYSPDHATPVYAKNLPTLAVSVLPAVGLSGFMVIDSAAQVWSIADAADTASLGQSLDELNLQAAPSTELVKASDDDDDEDEEEDKAEKTVDELEDDDDEEMDDANTADVVGADNDDEYGIEDAHDVVIAPEKLREIFDAAPSTAATSIEELFWEVSGLLSGLPSIVRAG